jgi:drug/metabolite transporter (DMT)-like permease
MTAPAWLWIVFTVLAAAAQTARSAMQRELTATLGTIGATHVRFLFGLPFSVVFLVLTALFSGDTIPTPSPNALAWIAGGALSQCLATGLMLSAMQDRSFVVATALIKIEPVWVALMSVTLLGEHISPPLALAILLATAGVMVVSWPGNGSVLDGRRAWPSMASGLAAGALFGGAAIGYRGGIQALGAESYVSGAATALFIALAIQTVLLSAYLYVRNRDVLVRIFHAWTPSLFAGFMGALASQFWFLAFALQSAALVRTLALVEILFAYGVSRRLMRQDVRLSEIGGMAMLAIGVIVLLNGR